MSEYETARVKYQFEVLRNRVIELERLIRRLLALNSSGHCSVESSASATGSQSMSSATHCKPTLGISSQTANDAGEKETLQVRYWPKAWLTALAVSSASELPDASHGLIYLAHLGVGGHFKG